MPRKVGAKEVVLYRFKMEPRPPNFLVSLEAVFEFGKHPICHLGYSRSSELIQVIDSSFRFILFDPGKRQIVRDHRLPLASGTTCADWTSEGRHVAFGGFNGTEVYEVWSGERVAKIPQHINIVSRLAWSNDRSSLAIGVRSIKVWNTASERYDISLDGHRHGIGALAWNNDDTMLASADERGLVIVWNVAQEKPIWQFSSQTNIIGGLAWSPDSRYLAIPALLPKQTIREGITIFDFQKGEIATEIESPWIRALKFRPSGGPFGDLLITKGSDEVKLWRYGSWECLCTIPEKSGNYVRPAIAVHPYADRFCSLDRGDKAIRLWSYDLKQLVALDKPCPPDLSNSTSIVFSGLPPQLGTGHNQVKFAALLKGVVESQDSHEKGAVLEQLCRELFALQDGFKVQTNIRTATEEIDLTIQKWVSGIAWLDDHAFHVLGECKNWSGKCGKNEYVIFKEKLLNRRGFSTLGFLISWNGFTDTVELESLRGSANDGPVIGLLSGEDLKEVAEKGNLLDVLLRSYENAIMR